MRVTVLGPQRRPTVAAVARDLDPARPIATVTAGWQDREPDDGELDGLLGGRSANLRLYARWHDVLAADPDYAAAERDHLAVLRQQRELYLIALDGVLRALHETARAGGDLVPGGARADAEAVVRLVDDQHLARVHEARATFEATVRVGERDAVARHRAEVGEIVAASSALVVTGGHVGVLLYLLRLFAVPAPENLIAWSAGAMALTERVLLFHDADPDDTAPQDPSHAEFLDSGLGWLRGCVLLPHARRRLRTDDPLRMAELAFRAAPARCVVLDDGARLDLGPDGVLPTDARVVTADGRIA